jgi:hypothetical protein
MTKNRTEELAAALQMSAQTPWCRTCDRQHPWNMPANTFRCEDCGFGGWDPLLTAHHIRIYPSHTVSITFHLMHPA